MIVFIIMLVLLTGCLDLSAANVFGCKKGERLIPTTRTMFGRVGRPAYCETIPMPAVQRKEMA